MTRTHTLYDNSEMIAQILVDEASELIREHADPEALSLIYSDDGMDITTFVSEMVEQEAYDRSTRGMTVALDFLGACLELPAGMVSLDLEAAAQRTIHSLSDLELTRYRLPNT